MCEPKELLGRGIKAELRGDYPEAMRLFQTVVERYADTPYAEEGKGSIENLERIQEDASNQSATVCSKTSQWRSFVRLRCSRFLTFYIIVCVNLPLYTWMWMKGDPRVYSELGMILLLLFLAVTIDVNRVLLPNLLRKSLLIMLPPLCLFLLLADKYLEIPMFLGLLFLGNWEYASKKWAIKLQPQ
jgi:hypothetical protein